MKRYRIITLMAVLLALPAVGQEVEVRELEPGRFQLTLHNHTALDEEVAQRWLRPRANEICGDANPQFGRYRFESNVPINRNGTSEKASSFQFTQELSCGGVADSAAIPQVDMGIQRGGAGRDLETFIREISIDYLTDRAEGDFEAAYGALSSNLRSLSPFDEWTMRAQQFNDSSGALRSKMIWRVTVYDDPPGAPEPGTYIAADYEIEFERIPLQCGYLMWFQLPEERFVVLREESGSIPSEVLERIGDDQLSQVRQQLGCAR